MGAKFWGEGDAYISMDSGGSVGVWQLSKVIELHAFNKRALLLRLEPRDPNGNPAAVLQPVASPSPCSAF